MRLLFYLIIGLVLFSLFYLTIGYQIYVSNLPPDKYANCTKKILTTYQNQYVFDNESNFSAGTQILRIKYYDCPDGIKYENFSDG